MRALRAEFKKSRRRYHFVTAGVIALFVLLWATQTGGTGHDRLQHGYSALFYAIPIMNAVIMPLGMAVLASRSWDMENKENTCRLLFTLQSRQALFFGKAILGLLENLLICTVEGAGVLALGRLYGYPEALSLSQLGWLVLCTFTVNEMLFFLWLWLSIHFSNQVPTLAAGMIASLSGLFAAFMPEAVSFFLPWGYYIPLLGMRMDWNSGTRVIRYVPVQFRFWLLAAVIVLLCACMAGAWRALRGKEV